MAEENNVVAVVEGNNQFTNKLYAQISKPNENLVFSPLSVHTVLSLLYQGSNGSTESAFKDVLNVPDKSSTGKGFQSLMTDLNNVQGITLEIANNIYVQDGCILKKTFKEIAIEQFFADAVNLNFGESVAAAEAINTWVEEKTKKKITDLAKPNDLDADTRLVLVNAVYFKGDWLDKFDKSRTTEEQFYISETDSVPCNMMHRSGRYNYKEDLFLAAKIIEMPYSNKNLSMLIILPNSRSGIADLEKKLATQDLTELSKHLRNVKVHLNLPRFKIESKIALNEPLKKLGLENAFGMNANFSDLLETNEQLGISKVLQKAFIEVNEDGAEAAAATYLMINRYCGFLDLSLTFVADRPFIIYLTHHSSQDQSNRDNNVQGSISSSRTTLFCGKVALPVLAQSSEQIE